MDSSEDIDRYLLKLYNADRRQLYYTELYEDIDEYIGDNHQPPVDWTMRSRGYIVADHDVRKLTDKGLQVVKAGGLVAVEEAQQMRSKQNELAKYQQSAADHERHQQQAELIRKQIRSLDQLEERQRLQDIREQEQDLRDQKQQLRQKRLEEQQALQQRQQTKISWWSIVLTIVGLIVSVLIAVFF